MQYGKFLIYNKPLNYSTPAVNCVICVTQLNCHHLGLAA